MDGTDFYHSLDKAEVACLKDLSKDDVLNLFAVSWTCNGSSDEHVHVDSICTCMYRRSISHLEHHIDTS